MINFITHVSISLVITKSNRLFYVQGSALFTSAAPLQAVGCVTQGVFPLSLRRQHPLYHGPGKVFILDRSPWSIFITPVSISFFWTKLNGLDLCAGQCSFHFGSSFAGSRLRYSSCIPLVASSPASFASWSGQVFPEKSRGLCRCWFGIARPTVLCTVCIGTIYFFISDLLPLPLGLTMTALFTESVQFSIRV